MCKLNLDLTLQRHCMLYLLFQLAIIEYLDETREGQRLLPKDSLHRAQVAVVYT